MRELPLPLFRLHHRQRSSHSLLRHHSRIWRQTHLGRSRGTSRPRSGAGTHRRRHPPRLGGCTRQHDDTGVGSRGQSDRPEADLSRDGDSGGVDGVATDCGVGSEFGCGPSRSRDVTHLPWSGGEQRD